MKKLSIYLFLSIIAFYSCNNKEKKEKEAIELDVKNSTLIAKGEQVPEFNFFLNGDTININSLKGKVVFMNFFATSCPICIEELPVIHNEIWSKYNNNQDFKFLVFGRGHNVAEMDSFRIKWEYTFDIVADPDKSIYQKFATKYIPRNIILDRDGKIIFETAGFDDEKFNEIKAILEKELNIK